MTSINSLQEKLSRLNNIKIDASTLSSLREKINNPLTYTQSLKKLRDLVASPKGAFSVSVTGSLVASIIIIPLQYSEFAKSQQTYSQYASEESQLKDIRSRKRDLIIRKQLLTKADQIASAYLDNSARLLLLPELIRISSSSHNLRLISFSPSSDQNSSDVIPPQTNQAQQQQSEPAIDGIPGASSDPSLNTSPMPTVEYSIIIEGDYLRILSFLNDIQSFKSFLGFKSVNYNSNTTSASPTLESQAVSGNGIVQSTILLSIPTRSPSSDIQTEGAGGE